MLKLIGRIFPGRRAKPMLVGEQQAKAAYARSRAERVEHVAWALGQAWLRSQRSPGPSDGRSWAEPERWRRLAEAAVTAMEEFDR